MSLLDLQPIHYRAEPHPILEGHWRAYCGKQNVDGDHATDDISRVTCRGCLGGLMDGRHKPGPKPKNEDWSTDDIGPSIVGY